MCDEGLVRRRKEDKARIVSGGLEIAREEVTETESDGDNDDHDELMRLNPCSVWPPVCGQVCISEPHQVKQTQNKGFCQLYLTVTWNLCAKLGTLYGVHVSL